MSLLSSYLKGQRRRHHQQPQRHHHQQPRWCPSKRCFDEMRRPFEVNQGATKNKKPRRTSSDLEIQSSQI